MSQVDQTKSAVGISLVSIIVQSYDEAIAFFAKKLGFELVEDSSALTNAGKPKRWVVVRPPLSDTSNAHNGANVLLARADGPGQELQIGKQFAGRVGMFWHVEDFEATYAKLLAAGVEFTQEPRTEAYGRFAVFLDISGNKWDLLGPAPSPEIEGQ